jgi:tetratricopeptide (TPR) repeat protein
MKSRFSYSIRRVEKRQGAAALQDAGALGSVRLAREAFWTAPALRRFGILLFVLLSPGNIFAGNAATDFSEANELYAKGKFSEAAGIYEKILNAGKISPALLFDYGNAEYKSGHLGRAITAYRRAALLSPRDAEVRANLAFVREQVQGATLRESRWQYWLGQLTLNEWTLLTATTFWVTFISLTARQIRPALGAKLKNATLIFVTLTILISATLGWRVATHFSKQTAVVIAAEATARSGPFEEAQSAFTPRDGAELAVFGRHGDWLQVVNGAGKIGWLPVKQVEMLPGA